MYPKVNVEGIELSKIVCGTNQFVAITHRINPLDMLAHLIRFRDVRTISKFMVYMYKNYGVNSCVSSPRQKLFDAIKMTEKKIGDNFHWICTPSVRATVKGVERDIFKQIDWCADHDVTFCGPHRMYTDNAIDYEKLTIGGLKKEDIGPTMFKGGVIPEEALQKVLSIPYPEIAEYIRDKGMIPMISSHYIEVLEAVDKNNYDAALIIQPLNKKGYQSDTTPEKLIEKIQSTSQRILNIKPMAAGRIKPQEGLEVCLKNIKEDDLLAVGFGKYKYMVEDGKILANIFQHL